jgi:hypothetical protein
MRLIGKLPTPFDDTGFIVLHAVGGGEQVIRYFALRGQLPTSPV